MKMSINVPVVASKRFTELSEPSPMYNTSAPEVCTLAGERFASWFGTDGVLVLPPPLQLPAAMAMVATSE
jgi:hypothetical protein